MAVSAEKEHKHANEIAGLLLFAVGLLVLYFAIKPKKAA